MKKLTKLVSAVAFASALALVGCANPAGGSAAGTINPTDVKAPTGYTPTANAKNITTKEEAQKAFTTLFMEYAAIQTIAGAECDTRAQADPENAKAIKDFSNYILATKEGSNFYSKDSKENYEGSFKAKKYTVDYGTLEVVEYNKKYSKEWILESKTEKISSNDMQKLVFDIKDTSKMSSMPDRATQQNHSIKSVKVNVLKTYKFNQTKVNEKKQSNGYVSEEKLVCNGALLFDTKEFNGVGVFELESVGIGSNSNGPTQKFTCTFYDLKGNKTLDKVELDIPAMN